MSARRMAVPADAPWTPAVEAATVMSFVGVSRSWGRGKHRRPVLRGVHLQIPGGAAVRVEGSNGAGKTTLLRIGAAILAPDTGTVTVDRLPSDGNWREYHRRIGFLSAGDRGLYARFSVRGHLDYAARIAFVPRAACTQAVDEALVRFGLGDLAKRRADRLSQGQRQRLRLALTVVHRPRVLLLDEPRNSLDAEGLAMLADAVADVRAAGGAVLWCSPAGEEQPVDFDRTYMIRDAALEAA
ncbi:MAG TPA: ABC transporter ATP-binding protein [Solirubrobacteraceae bacterium]|jgi:ABC-2 type transport system ATP-binding protein|nr:ABC transporter ATP-binding protein [Solirubrobacteraceae bacterium]